MLRFLLLKFLPRRLVPLLALIELVRLVRQWRARGDTTTMHPDRRAPSSRPAVTPRPKV